MDALWIISAFAGVVATMASLASAISGILLARRRGRWQSSQATVTWHRSQLVNTGPPAYYPATVRHAIARYSDLQRKEHTLKVREQPTGNTVAILFDPRHPDHACADEEFWTAGFLVALAVAAVSGLLLYLIPLH